MTPPRLNLPPISPRIENCGGTLSIYDNLRHKFVALTPEEWVRQHFTAWLINSKGYPRSLIANEIGLKVNGRPRRADTVVYDHSLRPIAVVEYKNADIAVTQQVFDQIVRYNMVFRAPCVMVSNGIHHFCCAIDFGKHSYTFLRDVPDWEKLLGIAAAQPPVSPAD